MDVSKLVWSTMTVLFFIGAIGALSTVVLFAAELVRIAFSKDETPHGPISEEQQTD